MVGRSNLLSDWLIFSGYVSFRECRRGYMFQSLISTMPLTFWCTLGILLKQWHPKRKRSSSNHQFSGVNFKRFPFGNFKKPPPKKKRPKWEWWTLRKNNWISSNCFFFWEVHPDIQKIPFSDKGIAGHGFPSIISSLIMTSIPQRKHQKVSLDLHFNIICFPNSSPIVLLETPLRGFQLLHPITDDPRTHRTGPGPTPPIRHHRIVPPPKEARTTTRT